MKKIIVIILWLGVYASALGQTPQTQLQGTLNNPDGSGFTGSLYLSISSPAAVSSAGSCGGPAQIVPNQSVNIAIQNGSMTSYTVTGSTTVHTGAPYLFGSDCTIPQGTPYNAILKDPQGNTMYSTQWLITGEVQNIGTVYASITPVPSNALLTMPGYGPPSNPCYAQTEYTQLDTQPGSNIWRCINGAWTQQTGSAGALAFSNIPGQLSCPQIPSITGAVSITGCSAALSPTGAVSGTYGSTTQIPSFTIGSDGRISSISNNAFTALAGTLAGTSLASNVTSAPGLTTLAGGSVGTSAYKAVGTAIGNVPVVLSTGYLDTSIIPPGAGGYFPGTVSVSGTPSNGLVLLATGTSSAIWTQLTASMLAPAFSASLSCTSNVTCGSVEAGNASTNPANFAMSYANPSSATSATLSDGTHTVTLSTPFTSGSLTYQYCTVGQGLTNFTFSLSASNGTQTANASQGVSCTYRTFVGVGTAGATGATASGSNVTLVGATGTLYNAGLNNQGSYTCTTTGTQYCYILMQGGSHTFTSGGFAFAMNSPTSITVTNQYGVVIANYYLYQSTNSFYSGNTFVIQVAS